MKKTVIKLVSVTMLGLGLFTLLTGEQQSAQAANAEALKSSAKMRGKPDCYSRWTSGDETIYDCGPCLKVVNAMGQGNIGSCVYGDTQNNDDILP